MANSRAHAASIGAVLIAGTLVFTAGGCNNNQLEGAKAEVQQGAIKVTVPAVPAFEVPKPNPDGSHTIKELRVQGQKYLKQEISVSGFVVWAYDCATAIRQPSEDDAAVKKRIEDDPTLCRRPAFYLGDAADTPVERAAWIVGSRACRPRPRRRTCRGGHRGLAGGAAVQGRRSGRRHRRGPPRRRTARNNTDGLLVYKQMKNVTQNWETPPLDPNALPPRPSRRRRTGLPEV
jgi:hypothetical protein